MKKEKILTLAVLLPCLCINASAKSSAHISGSTSARYVLALAANGPRTTASGMRMLPADGNVKVTGVVTDNTGETVIGATVRVKGVQGGTVTDLDGKFTISAPAGGVLVVSYLGYKTQEVTVPANGRLSIVLQPESRQIEEVVVTALGIKRSEGWWRKPHHSEECQLYEFAFRQGGRRQHQCFFGRNGWRNTRRYARSEVAYAEQPGAVRH